MRLIKRKLLGFYQLDHGLGNSSFKEIPKHTLNELGLKKSSVIENALGAIGIYWWGVTRSDTMCKNLGQDCYYHFIYHISSKTELFV